MATPNQNLFSGMQQQPYSPLQQDDDDVERVNVGNLLDLGASSQGAQGASVDPFSTLETSFNS